LGYRPLFVNSVPKSGTNLVVSVLSQIDCLRFRRLRLNHRLRWHPLNVLALLPSQRCEVGIGKPTTVALATLRRSFAGIRPGEYAAGHVPYDGRIANLLEECGVRIVQVIRDPRDVVLSQVFHALKRKRHFLHRALVASSDDRERLRLVINGRRRRDGAPEVRGIGDRLDRIAGWLSGPHTLVVRFEDLVGERGGGSAVAQTVAIRRIAVHVGVELSEADVERVGRDAFGIGNTYRRGRIGSWREAFDKELVELFKENAGRQLVELGYEKSHDWNAEQRSAGLIGSP
jgi:sulfotransferase 6B1